MIPPLEFSSMPGSLLDTLKHDTARLSADQAAKTIKGESSA